MARRSAPSRPARPSRRRLYTFGLAVTLAAFVITVIVVRQRGASPATAATERILQATYVGTTTCAGCHAEEHTAWRGSQHEQAMADATPDRVLGNFDNVTVR
ncbi:MAG: hypothetical protein IT183_02020, partial [Acidobacteria bacterium]|nr:hypothetical protein [Acidobacteriota bacterium]